MGDAVTERVKRVVRPEVQALAGYHVPPPPEGVIKLDAMENPYGWPDSMVDGWLERLRSVALNRYPDPRSSSLKQRLREVLDLPRGAELLLGNGSDELIALLVHGTGGPGRTILGTDPGFAMYRVVATASGARYEAVMLNADDFVLDRPATLEALERLAPSLVLIAYPNNPTGNLFDEKLIEEIVDSAPGLVVIDEAYAPFADATFVDRVLERPNLLVMRTVSKLGLAGLRLGYLVGAAAWIDAFDKIRLPYNVNVLTQVSAEFALDHYDVLAAQVATIKAERARLFELLSARPALRTWPSHANFLLVRLPEGSARRVCDGLLERGVMVRSFDGAAPSLADCIRVSVGKPAENDAFMAALDELLR